MLMLWNFFIKLKIVTNTRFIFKIQIHQRNNNIYMYYTD